METTETLKVDLFIKGGTVITMDPEFRVIEDGAVAIEGDTIAAVGRAGALEPRWGRARTIDATGTLVVPGMINGHAHAAMSLFRGIAEDHSLNDWLQHYIFPAEARNVTEEFVLWELGWACSRCCEGASRRSRTCTTSKTSWRK